MTEDLALYTFTIGLHSNISNIVRCRDPKTLNAAVNIAMEEEKILNTQKNTAVHIKPKFCNNCKKTGHLQSECYFNNKGNTYRFQELVPSSSNKPTTNQFPIICRYCKNVGHDILECRKRQFNNSRKLQQRSSYQRQRHIETHDADMSSPPQIQEVDNNDLN